MQTVIPHIEYGKVVHEIPCCLGGLHHDFKGFNSKPPEVGSSGKVLGLWWYAFPLGLKVGCKQFLGGN